MDVGLLQIRAITEFLDNGSNNRAQASALTSSTSPVDQPLGESPMFGGSPVKTTLLMTLRPSDIWSWPETSPLTPLLEPPFSDRIDYHISGIELVYFGVRIFSVSI
jgi:hypothetical protein